MLAIIVATAAVAAAQSSPAALPDENVKPIIHGADVCLPLKFAEGLPVIFGTIAGRPVSLGFDTGAPGIVHLVQPVVDELKLQKVGESQASDPSRRNVLTVGLYSLRDMRLGKFTIDQWLATGEAPSARRFANPDGIIGLDAFRGYVVTFDYPGRRLLITSGRLPEPNGTNSFHYKGPIPRVPLVVDGIQMDAHVDTGNARYSVVVPSSLATQLPGYAARFPIGTARTVNNQYDLIAMPVRDVKVGSFSLFAGTVAAPSPSPIGNIGSPILRDMILKVDPANSIVSFERAKPGLEDGCPSA